jgi:antitoxin (DNA-binding transcriptional repressor) of toxin-antitoxin stability system
MPDKCPAITRTSAGQSSGTDGTQRMETESESSRTKFVTARDLGKHPGELLDAVIDGARLVITRWGYPVAVMEATENVVLENRVRRRAPTERFEGPEDEIDLDSFDLGPNGWSILDALARCRTPSEVSRETGLGFGEVAMGLTRCEVHHLVDRTFGGSYELSKLGERALKAWKERD